MAVEYVSASQGKTLNNMHNMEKPRKDWNEGHPDHEGEMAVAQLHRISEMAKEMLGMIGKNDELQGWIQYKISRAFNDIGDAYNYVEAQCHMDGEDTSASMPTKPAMPMGESIKLIRKLVAEELKRSR